MGSADAEEFLAWIIEKASSDSNCTVYSQV
jgi:hypothetical protein